MNQVIENIFSRRSVRSYLDKAVPKEALDEIIKAGNAAPSGANTQDWRFVVIRDKSVRQKFVKLSIPRVEKWLEKYANESFKERRRNIAAQTPDPVYYNAPAIIFVIGKGNMTPYDCPMVCENMMLAARSLGLGSCWVLFGQLITDEPEVRSILELKDEEKVYGPILLGYPKDGFPPPPPKKEPVVKMV
jgi:nitroreductase